MLTPKKSGGLHSSHTPVSRFFVYLKNKLKFSRCGQRILINKAATYFVSSQINDRLRDALQTIINKQGIASLTRPQCINTLSDIYNFSLEIDSKKFIVEFFRSGILNEFIALQHDKIGTLQQAYIHLKNNPYHSYNSELVRNTVLTIISATSNISHDDILKFSKCTPSAKKRIGNSSLDNKSNSSSNNLKLIFSFIIGLLLLYGGTIFYLYMFTGCWLFFIVLITGFIHLGYIVNITNDSGLILMSNSDERERTKAAIFPVCIGMLLNAFIGFLFFSDYFCSLICSYVFDDISDGILQKCYDFLFGDYIRCDESESVLTKMLLAVDIFFLSSMILDAYTSFTGSKTVNFKKHTKLLLRTSIITIIGYIILFSIPAINRAWGKIEYARLLNAIKQDVIATINLNEQLRSSRDDLCPELSFKGTKLDMLFANIDSTNSKFHCGTYRLPIRADYSNVYEIDKSLDITVIDRHIKSLHENIYNSYNYDYKANEGDTQSKLADTFEEATMNFRTALKTDIIGMMNDFQVNFDNKEARVYIFENKGKVGAILVKVYSSNTDSIFTFSKGLYSSNTDTIYTSLKELYSQKYGIAEQIPKFSNDSKEEIYWTFKNGTIYITDHTILYISSSFISQLKKQSDLFKQERARLKEEAIKKQRLEQEAAERKRQQEYREAERKKQQREQVEKERREANHKKAFNEI